MTRSWLCLPLLLVGALLLGQPAWGAEEEEPPTGEVEEPSASVEAGEQTAPPSPEDEEELGEASGSSEGFGNWRRRTSEEHQKILIQLQRNFLEEDAAYSARPVPDFMKEMAVTHYNKHDWRSRYGNYYKHYENSHLDVEKAEGLIGTFEMTLAKTNCTREDVSSSHEGSRSRYTDSYLESQGCVLLPESEQEKVVCKFTVFIDDKHGRATVIDDHCVSVPESSESSKEDEEPSPEE